MKTERIKSSFLYCTLSREEYGLIKPLIWMRNKSTLGITSLLAASMGGLFLIINLISRSSVLLPYAILMLGSALIYSLNRFFNKKRSGERISLFLCYAEMVLVCLYAGILSIQESNYAIPATSIIVFIALLPLSIDDRPIRIYAFMIGESASYLIVSRFMKSGTAFSLDILNVATFSAVGMILYAVICSRNVREIYQSMRVEKIQQSVISSLATVVEERDEKTGGHITRTESYVKKLAGMMKENDKYSGLSLDYYKNVILAAPLHDVGKIKISDAILNKPGRLTDDEYEIMKNHTQYGAEIIEKTMKDVEDEEYFRVACNIAKYHHERFDGGGYPEGLKGEEIPLEARMMALADVYDALISDRVYKKAYPKEEARRILEEGGGTQFDPELLSLFLACVE